MAPIFNEELNDLTGKVVLITGATSGIGYAVTRELLRRGATVYLAARSENKATAVISRLEAESLGPGNGKPIWHKLELDNPHDVKESAEEFLAREARLDILINNAAFLAKAYTIVPIRVEDTVTVNYISPFVFTNLLLPLLKKTAQIPGSDVRIVNVGSVAHTFIRKAPQFRDKSDLNGPTQSDGFFALFRRYCFSKLMTSLGSNELARRLGPDSDVLVICLHPGSVLTESALGMADRFPWPISPLYKWFMRMTFLSPTEGATTVVVAAAQPELRREKEKYHGAYLEPFGKLASTSEVAADEGLAKDLWELTEKLLADEGLQLHIA